MGRVERWLLAGLVVAAVLVHGAMGRYRAVPSDGGKVVIVDGLTGERRICYPTLEHAAMLAKPHTVDSQNCMAPGATTMD